MGTLSGKPLLETSALIVGYAMSRLDREYLKAQNCRTWTEAFQQAGKLLQVRPASLKNLRDEFDPVHGNSRRGWKDRSMRPNRQRVMGELCDISDAALIDMVEGILRKDPAAMQEVVRPLSKPRKRIHNVAERLRTGRMAESFFLEHSLKIVGVVPSHILDHRALARGYDFGVERRADIAIEIKGLKQSRGGIAFTDREWREANARRDRYWLVVVGSIESSPIAKVIRDPWIALKAQCRFQNTITASWQAMVTVA